MCTGRVQNLVATRKTRDHEEKGEAANTFSEVVHMSLRVRKNLYEEKNRKKWENYVWIYHEYLELQRERHESLDGAE